MSGPMQKGRGTRACVLRESLGGGGGVVDRNRGMRAVHNLCDCLARLTGQGE